MTYNIVTLKKIEKKLPQLQRSKNYTRKFAIIDDLYEIIHKNVVLMKQAGDIDTRELSNITKSLESVMKVEYLLDSEVQVVNTNHDVLFEFD